MLWLASISATEIRAEILGQSPTADQPIVEVFRERYSDGKVKIEREVTFRNGLAVGDVRKRGADGGLTTVVTYVDGHQVVNKSTYFTGTNKKQSEASRLLSLATETSPDDF